MDIGVIVVTHSQLAEGFGKAAEMILGEQENFRPIAFNPGDDVMGLSQTLVAAMAEMACSDFVILADFFGASPSNASSIAITEVDDACLITGANLGMVIEALVMREQVEDLEAFSRHLVDAGRDGIRLVTKESILGKGGDD